MLLHPFQHRGLVGGTHLGDHPLDSHLGGHHLGGAVVIAAEHHHLQAEALQGIHRSC